MFSGLDLFQKHLHPRDVDEIRAWSKRPGLSPLLARLHSIRKWQQFLDYYAEAMVALYLIRQACELQYEVPTVGGGSADFRVVRGDNVLFAHLKRTNLDKATTKNLNICRRLDCLREIRRPITVSLTFYEPLTDAEMQHCCQEARGFIERAGEGERKEIVNMAGELLGEFEIGPRHNGEHVRFAEFLPATDGGYDDAVSRQFSHAYQRFMPGFENVILITDFWNDEASVDDVMATLDDFWGNGNHPLSSVVVHFLMDPRNGIITFEPFFRSNKVVSYVADIFQTVR